MKTTLNRFTIGFNRVNNFRRNQYEDFYEYLFSKSTIRILYRSPLVKEKIEDAIGTPIEIEEFTDNGFYAYYFSYDNGLSFTVYSDKEVILY